MITSSSQNEIGLIIFLTLLFYYFYYYTGKSKIAITYLQNTFSNQSPEIVKFLFNKLSGALFLGLLPAILYSAFFHTSLINRFGLSPDFLTNNWEPIFILVIVIYSILFLRHRSKPTISSLQMNFKKWDIQLFTINAFGWMIYLFCYEFLFRGILLFESFDHFGFWPAIAINITIYSAIHMVYGKEQAIGALIFGAIACYFALDRGTILIPFFMHASLSIFSDYFSIKQNPELSFVRILKAQLPGQ